jgi:diguanylate cyclase (GGDEF)-like protein
MMFLGPPFQSTFPVAEGGTVPRPPGPSFQDALTGLSNREHFEIVYEFAFQLADRGLPLTLVYLEVAGLSALRARAGDSAASDAVRAYAAVILSRTRAMDVAARLEDARFALLLADCNLHGGLVCADRVRAEAEAVSDRTGLSLSAGVASHEKGMTRKEDLQKVAAETLRVALAWGGDRIAVPADLGQVE